MAMAKGKVGDVPLRSSVQWFVYVILCLVSASDGQWFVYVILCLSSAGDGQWSNVCMEGGWVNSCLNNSGEG